MEKKSSIFKKISHLSNSIRVGLINFVFWAIVIGVIYFSGSGATEISSGDTLFIQLSGVVTDSPAEEEVFALLTDDGSGIPKNTLLRDVLFALDQAKYDSVINQVVLDLDYLTYVGLASAEEIGKALKRFKESGKNIYAYSSFYNRGQYYIASFADKISIDPYGEVSIDGISIYRNYWKEALDKYDVDVQIFRAGDYKSYVEPYLSTSMSNRVKEQNLKWMNSVWDGYLQHVCENRVMPLTELNDYFNNRLSLMKNYQGDGSLLAKKEGFIDDLETKGQFFSKFPNLYSYGDYNIKKRLSLAKNNIAVVSLEGTITYSDKSPGSISAINSIDLLGRVLAEDFEGLIVRINSGGGGVFASELIRRKVEEVAKKIPVVVSMGDVCASGGYWIATAGDQIFANESTITGSIGVFGMIFGLEDTFKNHLGIYSDGVSTTPNLEPIALSNNISQESGEIFQLGVDATYIKFLDLVGESRKLEMDHLKSIAGGRVWSGLQAKENGLVDSLGGLSEVKEFFGTGATLEYLDEEVNMLNKVFTSISNVVKMPEIKVLEELTLFDKIHDPKNIYALW